MDIQKLRTFLAVCRSMSFTEAAYDLNFTTSAVSKHVISLEKELGLSLFERHGKDGITLTNKAHELLPYVERVLEAADGLDAEVRRLSGEVSISLGSFQVIPPRVVSLFITNFQSNIPGARIETRHLHEQELLLSIQRGSLDIGMVVLMGGSEREKKFLEQVKGAGLESRFLLRDRDVIMLNPRHKLANKPVLSFEDIIGDAELEFLFVNPNPDKPSDRQEIFRRACAQRGLVRKTRVLGFDASVSMDVIRQKIAQDVNCAAFAPLMNEQPDIVQREIADGIYKPTIYLLFLRDNPNHVLRDFLAYV